MRSWAEHSPTEMADDWSLRLPPRKEWAEGNEAISPCLSYRSSHCDAAFSGLASLEHEGDQREELGG